MTPRTVRRMIKAALSEREACAARMTDLAAFVRVLEESLVEEPDKPTIAETPTSKSGQLRLQKGNGAG